MSLTTRFREYQAKRQWRRLERDISDTIAEMQAARDRADWLWVASLECYHRHLSHQANLVIFELCQLRRI